MIVGIATATDAATTNEFGVQVECIISDYLSKDKLVETPITLFHPPGSRFANQTTMIKRGSSIFFSGALTQVETNLYLELHSFSFIRNQSLNQKQMPWSKSSTQTSDSSNLTSANIARSIHNKRSSNNPIPISAQSNYKKSSILDSPISNNPEITQIPDNPITQSSDDPTNTPDDPTSTIPKTLGRTRKNPPTPISTPPKKRITRSYKPKNKAQKLADIASNIISVADSDPEEFDEE